MKNNESLAYRYAQEINTVKSAEQINAEKKLNTDAISILLTIVLAIYLFW